MGWYGTQCATRAELIRELTAPEKSESTGKERKVLAYSTAGNILWSVWEVTAPGADTRRIIKCDLLARVSDGWGYKPMSEEAHPFYYTCPLKYLEMVPEKRPEWRAQVRGYWAKRKERLAARRALKAKTGEVAHV